MKFVRFAGYPHHHHHNHCHRHHYHLLFPALESRLGTDVQKELPKLSGDLLKCLNTVYFIGLLDGRDSDQCVYSGYTLTAMMVINCLIIGGFWARVVIH